MLGQREGGWRWAAAVTRSPGSVGDSLVASGACVPFIYHRDLWPGDRVTTSLWELGDTGRNCGRGGAAVQKVGGKVVGRAAAGRAWGSEWRGRGKQ